MFENNYKLLICKRTFYIAIIRPCLKYITYFYFITIDLHSITLKYKMQIYFSSKWWMDLNKISKKKLLYRSKKMQALIRPITVNFLFIAISCIYSKFNVVCGDYLIIWQNFWKFCFLFRAFFHVFLHVFCSGIHRLWNNIILMFLNFNLSIQIIFF